MFRPDFTSPTIVRWFDRRWTGQFWESYWLAFFEKNKWIKSILLYNVPVLNIEAFDGHPLPILNITSGSKLQKIEP